jgi:asparagine synthase (glutamine-hydrolysing)
VTSADARLLIQSLPVLYDEPFDSSQIPTHLVCCAARGQVTAALSGDEGDELFGCYDRYFLGPAPLVLVRLAAGRVATGPGRRHPAAARASMGRAGPRFSSRAPVAAPRPQVHGLAQRLQTLNVQDDPYRGVITAWPDGVQLVRGANRLPTQLDNPDLVANVPEAEHRMMLWDSLPYLPDDILTKVDRAAMGVSMETRDPHLDHRVFELA